MIKKYGTIFTLPLLVGLLIIACSWRPSVAPVAMTSPWNQLNLPVKENAVVWASDAKQFKAVHNENKKIVMAKYVDSLKAQGWALTNFDDKQKDIYFVDMAKGSDKIQIEIYDFDGTGVIIRKS